LAPHRLTFRYELAPIGTENDALGREEAVS